MVQVDLQMLTEMNITVNGKETKPMDKVNIHKRMALRMKVSGNMIYSMAKVKNNSMIFLSTTDNIIKASSKDKMNAVFGIMAQNILEDGTIIKLMETACSNGEMVDNTLDNGLIMK